LLSFSLTLASKAWRDKSHDTFTKKITQNFNIEQTKGKKTKKMTVYLLFMNPGDKFVEIFSCPDYQKVLKCMICCVILVSSFIFWRSVPSTLIKAPQWCTPVVIHTAEWSLVGFSFVQFFFFQKRIYTFSQYETKCREGASAKVNLQFCYARTVVHNDSNERGSVLFCTRVTVDLHSCAVLLIT